MNVQSVTDIRCGVRNFLVPSSLIPHPNHNLQIAHRQSPFTNQQSFTRRVASTSYAKRDAVTWCVAAVPTGWNDAVYFPHFRARRARLIYTARSASPRVPQAATVAGTFRRGGPMRPRSLDEFLTK